eukprot:gene13945-9964_t
MAKKRAQLRGEYETHANKNSDAYVGSLWFPLRAASGHQSPSRRGNGPVHLSVASRSVGPPLVSSLVSCAFLRLLHLPSLALGPAPHRQRCTRSGRRQPPRAQRVVSSGGALSFRLPSATPEQTQPPAGRT